MRDRDYEQELEDFYGEDTFENVPVIEEYPDSRQRIAEAIRHADETESW